MITREVFKLASAPSIATTVAEMLANPNLGALADVVAVDAAEVAVALEVMNIVVDISVALMLPLAVNVSAAQNAVRLHRAKRRHLF
jgi:hypothetical protein